MEDTNNFGVRTAYYVVYKYEGERTERISRVFLTLQDARDAANIKDRHPRTVSVHIQEVQEVELSHYHKKMWKLIPNSPKKLIHVN